MLILRSQKAIIILYKNTWKNVLMFRKDFLQFECSEKIPENR